MNIMEITATVTMLLGFAIGFYVATRAALQLLAEKDAKIEGIKAALKTTKSVTENYREEFLRQSIDLELLRKYFPHLISELSREAQRRADVDKRYHLLDRDDRLDEAFCRSYFDNNLVVEKQTTLKPVQFVKPVIRPFNPMLPMVIDLSKEVNNLWPKFYDALDEIEDAELYWDFKIPTESAVNKSKQHYDRLDRTSQYGGLKTKWSTVNGREFGAKRKNKISRSKLKQAKRSNKEQWLAFNELYEEDLPYVVEKVILHNIADSYKAQNDYLDSVKEAIDDSIEYSMEQFLLAK